MTDTNSEEQKRARQSETHSTKVTAKHPFRIRTERRAQTDASFACISPEQSISGILVEPLQRINAKSCGLGRVRLAAEMFLAYGTDANDSRADGGEYTKLHAPRRGDFENGFCR